MSGAATCKSCGQLLPSDGALEGLCARCFFEAGLQQTKSGERLAPGIRIGPYEIEGFLGQGGMGEVYRARDTRLNRPVAIKFLSPDLADPAGRRRFQREAQMASALNHPHIVTVYDVGEVEDRQYLVMEFADAGTLRDWTRHSMRSWRSVIEILLGVADGLSKAHEAGILHRDIKPENILVTGDRYAKLADFGLAKVSGGAPSEITRTLTAGNTRGGMIVGIIGYMSPEQASGEPLDARSDIFSFGAVLYELLSGHRPFSGSTDLEVLQKVIHDQPQPLGGDVPAEVRMVVEKALEKDRANRYQSMRDMAGDLRRVSRPSGEAAKPAGTHRRSWLLATAALALVAGGFGFWRLRSGAVRVPKIRSVAVLPLQNLSGDPNQEFFSDGATEELISTLGQIHAFEKVISRTSVMRYKGSSKSLPQIARELGVDAVVEGSIERSAGRIRIRAELIDASDTQLWSRQYDRKGGDLLGLEAEVASAIAHEIRLQVTPQENARLARERKINPAAQEEYLLGKYLGSRALNPENRREAIRHFEKAIEIQRDFAAPYAGLTSAWVQLETIGGAGFQEGMAAVRSSALRAIELDPDLSDAHLAMSTVAGKDKDYPGMITELERAIALDPNNADAHLSYGAVLVVLGRSAEAIPEIERAAALDPLSPTIQGVAGGRLCLARRWDLAAPRLRRSIELDPQNPGAYNLLAETYEMTGNLPEALRLQQEAERLGGIHYAPEVGRLHALLGHRREALYVLQRVTKPGALTSVANADFELALLYFALKDRDHGFEQLTKAMNVRPDLYSYIKDEARFDSIRSDSRFQGLLRRFGPPKQP